ncbi:MAG TPA: Spo0E family sporulation regulatory protein-aspartic acid phosphatase [Candidatus Atribacteria bacterium]|nr:Spo0E family sporulation regulatory protein-aspartic acid phosphatase [Candidatus Atribacteria bacterium]
MQKESLKASILKLQHRLNDMTVENSNLSSNDIVELSSNLDHLIVQYLNLEYQEKIKNLTEVGEK